MKKFGRLIIIAFIINVLLIRCEKNDSDENFLVGTWIDTESFAMQFLDFFSNNTGRFGLYSRNNFTKYDSFTYRLIDNQLAIDFLGDNESIETIHDLIIIDNETIEISDLTIIPENPNKRYVRRDLITERESDTIIIGYNQIYFDFSDGFRLKMDSVINDSRCPIGATCFWEGNAVVLIDLIIGGNFQHKLNLNTNSKFRTDTVIDNIKFELVGLIPYPDIDRIIEQKDYKVKLLTEKL